MMSAKLLPRRPRRTVASPPTSRIAAPRKINQASRFMSLSSPSSVSLPNPQVEKQLNRNWQKKTNCKPTKPPPIPPPAGGRLQLLAQTRHHHSFGRDQVRKHGRRARVAPRGITLQCAQNNFFNLRRERRVQRSRRHWVTGQSLAPDEIRIVAGKRRGTGQHLVQHPAKTVNVRAPPTALALNLFRRDVGYRSHRGGRTAQMKSARLNRLGQAKINQTN